jgi:hypothetical protein
LRMPNGTRIRRRSRCAAASTSSTSQVKANIPSGPVEPSIRCPGASGPSVLGIDPVETCGPATQASASDD